MSLELRFFGQSRIHFDQQDLTAQVGNKPLAVMAFIALASAPIAREKLAGTFWPDKTDQAAYYRLRHTLWELRRLTGDQYIASDNSNCWLNRDADVRVDVLDFVRGCESLGIGTGRFSPDASQVPGLTELAELYRGGLLDGIVAQDAPLFDEWLLVERERFELLNQEVLWSLASAQQKARDDAGAAQTLTRLIQTDPLRERSYRALMKVHARQGDRAGALRVYAQCAQALDTDLGIEPSPETQQLRDRIARGAPENLGTEIEHTIAQAEAAIAEGRAEDARTLLQSARQAVRNFFR